MMKINESEIFPPELALIFQSLEYEEFSSLSFRAITQLEDEVNFDFVLYLNDKEEQEIQSWRLKILNYVESKIEIENLGNYFHFYSDHYLLKEFNDVQTELYFKKQTQNPELIIADFYELHKTKFRNLISMGKFLRGIDFIELSQIDNGLFASGPKYILDYYFEILKKHGCEPYFYGETKPYVWRETRWSSSDSQYKLVLMDRTYMIGGDFKFERLD